MQCGNDRKIELDLARYINKLAADFRSLHEQAWQIPVLIIATISFVLVAYSQISNPGKGFVLTGGSLIVFVPVNCLVQAQILHGYDFLENKRIRGYK